MEERLNNKNNYIKENKLNESYSDGNTQYFLELCSEIIGSIKYYYSCEVKNLYETGYSKESLKNLIRMIEDKSFTMRTKKDIANVLTEMGYKISKQLSSVPVNISDFTKKLSQDYGSAVGLTDQYKVYYNKKALFEYEEIRPIETIYTILHELYHVKQFNNFNQFLRGLPYEEDAVNTMVVEILSNTYLDDDEINKIKNENRGYSKESLRYDGSTNELEANLFASSMLKKYIEKGYFKESKKALQVLTESTEHSLFVYNKNSIETIKDIYLHNLKMLSNVMTLDSNKDFMDLPKDVIKLLQAFYDSVSKIDINKHIQKKIDKVEKMKTDFLINGKYETYKSN